MLARQSQALIYALEEEKTHNMELEASIQAAISEQREETTKATVQRDNLHADLKSTIHKSEERQKKLFQEKIEALEISSYQKYKLLETKHTASRI